MAGKRTSAARTGRAQKTRTPLWNYPRRGKGPIRRWLPSWRFILGSILAVIAIGVGAFAYLYATTDVPEPDDFALAQSTDIYYADGETKLGTFADVQRTSVSLTSLPEYVPHAVVASEDQRFYENAGVDIRGTARAAINNLRGLPRQGGSTLTQQYVERYYMGTTTDIAGKLREAVLALKIDQEQSKDEILENYLNTIYFGRGTYGIQEAAQAYFDVDAADLTLDQTALLVAVIPSPSRWDPAVDPDTAAARWERVIRRMTEDGWITPEQAAEARFPQTVEPASQNQFAGPTGHILDEVRRELVRSEAYTEDELDTLGLDIVTTIDADMQQYAVDAVANLPEDRPDNNYVGLVSVDPETGEIRAMFGGDDYLERSRNSATQDRAQAGSTFKPFGLMAGIEADISLREKFDSSSPYQVGDLEFENFQLRGLGEIDLLEATANSVNTVYIKLNEEVGPAATRDVAVRAGLPESTPGLDDTLSNVLGSASPTAKEMAGAYSTFASQGVRTTPHIVREVRNVEGEVTYRGDTSGDRMFDSGDTAQLTYALEQVVSPGGTAAQISQLGRPVAGKTGTSSFLVSAWFAGYVPQLVTVVDMYQIGPNGEEESLTPFGGAYAIQGGGYPAQIWLDFMMEATRDMPVENFPTPQIPEPTATPIPTVAPTTEAPTEEPTTEEPTEEPTTEEPTEEPTTEEPTEEPTTEEPAEEPTTEEPTTPVTPNPPPTTPPGQGDGRPGRPGGDSTVPDAEALPAGAERHTRLTRRPLTF
ncbi:penicillin-binding protein [Flaviflexus salsibiostraticola]|uniref:Penicillin-binding protein n=1 Tax=Flaviflexus salsibiostraticola TaxID=1282737 RepID=A0A3S8Z9S8_9ACTO|nr:transglycosylase domain-containing protein [Flaviflexus salsibiostraticola]AZN30287.1 penicillin-binding protein [Flaviflexus salsibiostraticola]